MNDYPEALQAKRCGIPLHLRKAWYRIEFVEDDDDDKNRAPT